MKSIKQAGYISLIMAFKLDYNAKHSAAEPVWGLGGLKPPYPQELQEN